MTKGTKIGLGIVGGIILLILITVSWFVGHYNTLVTMEENVTQAWSQVENQYQRRADLIPNLVNTVKGYAEHEKETFLAVTEARAKVSQMNVGPEILNDPQAFQKFQAAQDGLSSALSRLLVTVEKYPDLKANENFLQLQAQLEGTENRISVERRKFNKAVQEYNTTIRKFPTNIIAGMTGFTQKAYFKATAGSEIAPKVKF
jgi:LemA protein